MRGNEGNISTSKTLLYWKENERRKSRRCNMHPSSTTKRTVRLLVMAHFHRRKSWNGNNVLKKKCTCRVNFAESVKEVRAWGPAVREFLKRERQKENATEREQTQVSGYPHDFVNNASFPATWSQLRLPSLKVLKEGDTRMNLGARNRRPESFDTYHAC